MGRLRDAENPVEAVEVTIKRRDGTMVRYAAKEPADLDATVTMPLHPVDVHHGPADSDRAATARVTLAWLMWCYEQGYADPADRAILTNFMADDPDTHSPGDAETMRSLLAMADEVLAIVAAERDEQHG